MSKQRARVCGAIVAAAIVTTLAVGMSIGQAATGKRTAAASSLKSACGSTIVIQTDWFPEPEHGALYQLAGTSGTIDKAHGRYTGTIGKTGVSLEIRAGGPFTGFQNPISQMYQDKTITLGYVGTDEEVQLAKKLPLVSIVSPNEFSPQILMWNPSKLHITKFADIKATAAKVLVFQGGVFIDYLVGKGWIDQSQIDASYDGSPARFVAADGAVFQQGFATSEPYQYEHDISSYAKPVQYLLIRNSGYVPYPETIGARPEDVKTMAACFKQLVPLIQQAQVDYVAKPGPVNAKLIEIVNALNTFWKLSPGGNAYNVATQLKLKIVSNGPNCTLGDFDMKRVQQTIDQVTPIFKAKGLDTINPALKASDIATNQFIDPKIGLASKTCKKKK